MPRLRLVVYTREFLDRSWDWLQDPETMRLTMTPEFSREDQEKFFNSLAERRDYRIWGVMLDGVGPIGAAGLKNIRDNKAEYWGYIGEKALWGRGLGGEMLSAVEDKARGLGLQLLSLKVTDENRRAIRLYQKAGYRPVGSGPGVVLMERQLGGEMD